MELHNANQAQLDVLATDLRLPTFKRDALILAEAAHRQQRTHLDFLIEMMMVEWEEKCQRRTALRLKEARFPHCKTFEMFDFSRAPHLPEALLRTLMTGEYIHHAEPIIFFGEPGTGKTHLAIALGVAAAHQGYRVKFITVAELANLLMEAKDARILSNTVKRFAKPDVLILDLW